MKELQKRIYEIINEGLDEKYTKFQCDDETWKKFRNKWSNPDADGDFTEELKEIIPNMHEVMEGTPNIGTSKDEIDTSIDNAIEYIIDDSSLWDKCETVRDFQETMYDVIEQELSKIEGLDEDLKDVIKSKTMTNPKDGKKHAQFVVDPKNDKSFNHKDVFKKHGAKWFNGWNWTAWDDDIKKILNDKIKPSLEEIAKMDGEDPTQIADILVFLENEMNEILAGNREEDEVSQINTHLSKKSAEDIKNRVKELENKLINMTSAEDFKNFMRPILQFRNTSKQKFSFGNTILIWIQDPEATFVQSIGNWDKKWNRTVSNDAKLISLYVPSSQKEKREVDVYDPETDETKTEVRTYNHTRFYMRQRFTDIRFTKPIEGKENKLKDYEQGLKNLKELKWHEDGTIDEDLKILMNAIERVCKDEGIDVRRVAKDSLGGALGTSSNGGKTIQLIDGTEVNEGFAKTAVHELTHSLCHWENSRFKMKKSYGNQEQEAELCAWAVLCIFGYEATTEASVNYIGAWGLTAETAREVFNRMGKVISYIVNKIQEQIEKINSEDIEDNKEETEK